MGSADKPIYDSNSLVSVLFSNTFEYQMRRGASRSITQRNKSPIFGAVSGLATRAIHVERIRLKVLLRAARNCTVAMAITTNANSACRKPNITSMTKMTKLVSCPVSAKLSQVSMISIHGHSAASKTIKIKTIRAHFLGVIGNPLLSTTADFGHIQNLSIKSLSYGRSPFQRKRLASGAFH